MYGVKSKLWITPWTIGYRGSGSSARSAIFPHPFPKGVLTENFVFLSPASFSESILMDEAKEEVSTSSGAPRTRGVAELLGKIVC